MGGQTWSGWEEHSRQERERLRPCDVREQAMKETSGSRDWRSHLRLVRLGGGGLACTRSLCA